MKTKKYVSWHQKLVALIAAISCIIVLFMLFLNNIRKSELTHEDELGEYMVSVEDGKIHINWRTPKATNLKGIQLKIADREGTIVEIIECGRFDESYVFSEGEHGTLYKITASLIHKDGYISHGIEKVALFLDDNRLPDLPIININTSNGKILLT